MNYIVSWAVEGQAQVDGLEMQLAPLLKCKKYIYIFLNIHLIMKKELKSYYCQSMLLDF